MKYFFFPSPFLGPDRKRVRTESKARVRTSSCWPWRWRERGRRRKEGGRFRRRRLGREGRSVSTTSLFFVCFLTHLPAVCKHLSNFLCFSDFWCPTSRLSSKTLIFWLFGYCFVGVNDQYFKFLPLYDPINFLKLFFHLTWITWSMQLYPCC